ncbi:MAG TPA: SCO family protein [Fimbriimonadaceae bacterium]|nr:SCO family protein [Fimbriimonadaceae bacterium]
MKRNGFWQGIARLAAGAFVFGTFAWAQNPALEKPSPFKSGALGVDQKLGNQLPLDLEFTDESGRTVKLGDYFGKKPVVLIPVFYGCQGVCKLTMDGVLKAFNDIKKLNVGKDYTAITFTIHPKETPEMAAKLKVETMLRYPREGAAEGWHFLTGKQESIAALTDALGFRYIYEEPTGFVDHPAAIMIATPDGKISQYFINVNYTSKLVMRSIEDAGHKEIGVVTEPVWFGCLARDPKTGALMINVMNTLKFLGVVTVLVIGAWIAVMTIRAKRRARTQGAAS